MIDTNEIPAVGAVILAAGASARMGEAKQWLRLGDSAVLARVLTTVQASSVDEAILVLGFAAERVGELAGAPGVDGRVKVVVNSRYGEGMTSSLQTGLAALRLATAAALIVLADQPLVRPETLDRIADEYRRSRCQIVIPTYKGERGNPVLIDRNLFPEMMALRGDIGARAVFARHQEGIVRLPVDDAGILLDIDSRQDFEELERWARADNRERAKIEAASLQRRVRSEESSGE